MFGNLTVAFRGQILDIKYISCLRNMTKFLDSIDSPRNVNSNRNE